MNKNTMHPRRLARQMAKAQFAREKITGCNRKAIGPRGLWIPSAFARGWQKMALRAAALDGSGNRKRKKQ